MRVPFMLPFDALTPISFAQSLSTVASAVGSMEETALSRAARGKHSLPRARTI